MFIAKTAHSFIAVITVAFCYYGAKEPHLCCLEVHVLLLFILHLKSLPLVCDNIIISMETNQIVMKWNTYIKFGPFYLLSIHTVQTTTVDIFHIDPLVRMLEHNGFPVSIHPKYII